MPAKKLLFLVAEDHYFWSHRLPLALAAKERGYEVILATRVHAHQQRIEEKGIRVIPLISFKRTSIGFFSEIKALVELFKVYGDIRPDIVHHVALKPVLYGAIISFLRRVPRILNALAGLGYVFSAQTLKARFIRLLMKPCFQFFLNRKGSTLIVQNTDDYALMLRERLVKENHLTLIKGSGVDLDHYAFKPEPEMGEEGPKIAFAARMLREKGVYELVEATRLLRDRGVTASVHLYGDMDPENPHSLRREELVSWHETGLIFWHGKVEDMAEAYQSSHIATLPSYYGEGIPKTLLEAAAVGRPLITTDHSGCREVVIDGKNGFLIPTKDSHALAEALERLIEDRELRVKMGKESRRIARDYFSLEKVLEQTLALYEEE